MAYLSYSEECLLQVAIILMIGWTFLMWWKDFMLYRGRFRQVMWLSTLLALHSSKRKTVFFYILAIWCSVILFFTPLPINYLLKLAVLVTFFSRLSAILRPPGILLLASSNSWNYKLIVSVLRPRTLYPIRYLLRVYSFSLQSWGH
jgi:hypothetical protein